MNGATKGIRLTRGIATALVAGTALMACADTDTALEPSQDGAPTVERRGDLTFARTKLVASDGEPVTITLEDTFFDPAYVTAPPGSRLELRVRNLSGTQHNFSMENTAIDVDLRSDEERTLTVDVPSSGFRLFFCKYHTAAGMNGELLPTGSQPIPVQGTPRSIP